MKVFFISLFQWACILCLVPGIQAQIPPTFNRNFTLQDQEPFPLNYAEICHRVDYPPLAARNGIEGLVQVWINVDAEGRYSGHEIVGNSHPLLASALIPHLSCLSFTPAFHKGKAVRGWKALAFRFRITHQVKFDLPHKGGNYICPQSPAKDSFPSALGNVQIE